MRLLLWRELDLQLMPFFPDSRFLTDMKKFIK